MRDPSKQRSRNRRERAQPKAGQGASGPSAAVTTTSAPRREAPSHIGKRGEDRAASFLCARGYSLIERNFSCTVGELDIIARDGHTLVFVEVRYRSSGRYGSALETVGMAKMRQITRVARCYLDTRRPRFRTFRFDVVGITGDRIDLIQDAFRIGFDGA